MSVMSISKYSLEQNARPFMRTALWPTTTHSNISSMSTSYSCVMHLLPDYSYLPHLNVVVIGSR